MTPRTDRPPRLLLLLPRSAYRAGPFLSTARDLDYEVIVGSNHRTSLPGGQMLELPLGSPGQCAERIAELNTRRRIDAVFGVDEATSTVAAAACRQLGLPGNPPQAVAILHDKLRFRCWLSARGLRAPRFMSIHATSFAPPAAGYPWVVKPRSLSASRGVVRVDHPGAFADAVADLNAQMSGVPEPRALAESYIPGVEVTLEGLLVEGTLHTLALFDKPDTPAGPAFPETLYVTPSRLPQQWQAACHNEVQSLTHQLHLTTGPIHAELRVNADGCWLIEVAARPIGGLCASLLRFGNDETHESLLLRQAVGERELNTAREPLAAGVLMLPVEQTGHLRTVEGLEAAARVPGIENVHITLARGQAVAPLPWGDPYLGFVFAKASTPSEVEHALRTAKRKIRPVII